MTERLPVARLAPGQVTPKLRRLCEDFVLAFWGALRVTRYHMTDNDAVLHALRQLRTLLNELFDLQFDVSLIYYADDFYVNEVRLRTSPALNESFSAFAAHLRARHISGVRFAWTPSLDGLARIVSLLKESQAGGTPMRVADIRRELARVGVGGIELTPYTGDEVVDLPQVDAITFVRQAYFRAIALAEDIQGRARARRPIEMRLITRMVQTFVDIAQTDDPTVRMFLVAITGIKNWRSYLANHAVNTCVLSVCFGSELGLNRDMLRELGAAAFMADIGNAYLPEDLFESEVALTEAQRKTLSEHPLRGLTAITGRQRLNRVMVAAALGSATHHRGSNGGGYPVGLSLPKGVNQHIIAICDRYDALTSPRPYRPEPFTRSAALVDLLGATSTGLHPVIARAFALWVRHLPACKVVMTAAGDFGVVR